MASPTTSRTCLRRLATRQISGSNHRAANASRRLIHTPAPLHLDFLAPSWRILGPTSSSEARFQHRKPDIRSQRRQLSTTPLRRAIAIANPRKDDSGNPMSINITRRAAHRLQTISETDSNPDLALRVMVESGGCHGFQYLMSLVKTSDIDTEEDTLFENEEPARKGDGDYRAKIVIDEPSLELLNGSSIDYTMELIGSQFKVTGIPGAKSSCGCGTSFDIAV